MRHGEGEFEVRDAAMVRERRDQDVRVLRLDLGVARPDNVRAQGADDGLLQNSHRQISPMS